MDYKNKKFFIYNGCDRGLCLRGCGRQDRQLNTYDWLADVPGNAQSTDLVEVQFKNTRKGYYHNVNNLDLRKGDIVAVEANPGHDIGVVTLTGRAADKEGQPEVGRRHQAHIPHSKARGHGKIPRGKKPRARYDDTEPTDSQEP